MPSYRILILVLPILLGQTIYAQDEESNEDSSDSSAFYFKDFKMELDDESSLISDLEVNSIGCADQCQIQDSIVVTGTLTINDYYSSFAGWICDTVTLEMSDDSMPVRTVSNAELLCDAFRLSSVDNSTACPAPGQYEFTASMKVGLNPGYSMHVEETISTSCSSSDDENNYKNAESNSGTLGISIEIDVGTRDNWEPSVYEPYDQACSYSGDDDDDCREEWYNRGFENGWVVYYYGFGSVSGDDSDDSPWYLRWIYSAFGSVGGVALVGGLFFQVQKRRRRLSVGRQQGRALSKSLM